jgi:hypothetical protein
MEKCSISKMTQKTIPRKKRDGRQPKTEEISNSFLFCRLSMEQWF